MKEPTINELLKMKNPGKYLVKFIKENPTKYLNLTKHIEIFKCKSIDPISWIYETIIKKNKYPYIHYYFIYTRARTDSNSKELWSLLKSFSKYSNKWEYKFKKISKETYVGDIQCFSAIAHIVNPDKFSYVNKYFLTSIGEMSVKRYIENVKSGGVIIYNKTSIKHSFTI